MQFRDVQFVSEFRVRVRSDFGGQSFVVISPATVHHSLPSVAQVLELFLVGADFAFAFPSLGYRNLQSAHSTGSPHAKLRLGSTGNRSELFGLKACGTSPESYR